MVYVYKCALLIVLVVYNVNAQSRNETRCSVPQKAPKNIEKIIAKCQDEIKYAILTEALESLNEQAPIGEEKSRRRRSIFNDDEKRIAGCLLHCVFKNKKALNEQGFPTLEGLVNLYAEGITEKAYVLATIQAVHICLSNAKTKQLQSQAILKEHGVACDLAFDVFDCVSDKIADLCGQRP